MDRRSLCFVAFAAVAAHASALWGDFIWLDHAHIEQGLALAPAGEWLSLFTHGFAGTGFYRPLMSASLSLDAALGGAPWLYHATNLGFHAAAAVLTLLAGQTLGLTRRAALLAALLFAVHPLTSLVANAIAFRSESMITVALLSLVVLHRRGHLLGAALALLLGALSKETALVLGPLFVLALELFPGASETPRPARNLRLLAAEGGALLVALILRFQFAPAFRASFVPLSLSDALGTRLAALAKSNARLVLPFDLSVCDAFPVASLSRPQALLGGALLIGLVYYAYRRRGPALLLLLALLPALELVPIMRWWSPHYLYLGLSLAAMLAAETVTRWGNWAVRSAAAATLVLAGVSLFDGLSYQNDRSFWSREVSQAPSCREAHFYLGELERTAKRWPEAVQEYERALAVKERVLSYVDRLAALENLGAVQLGQRNLAQARAAFRAALELTNNELDRRHLLHNLATTELVAGNAEEAARLLEQEVQREDAMPAAILLRARAEAKLGRSAEATALVQRLRRDKSAAQP
jgi:tetratricopeptide (TPR) repeat protein